MREVAFNDSCFSPDAGPYSVFAAKAQGLLASSKVHAGAEIVSIKQCSYKHFSTEPTLGLFGSKKISDTASGQKKEMYEAALIDGSMSAMDMP